jgi:trehalose/maltose transport system substrate-binding protein
LLTRLFLTSCLLSGSLLTATAPALGKSEPKAAGTSRVTLTMAGLSYAAANQLPNEGLNEFIQKTGISVSILPTWGNSTDQLAVTRRTLMQHFRTPDVYVIDVIWPGALGKNFLDLTPFLDKDTDRQLTELLKNDTVHGRLVSLPFYLNIGMLYYRTDLLKKYGYGHPPKTWSELKKMAARIQRGERKAGHPDFWGYVWQGGAYEGLTCNALEWQVSFGGGKMVEPDGTITVNNPRTAAALRMATGWVGSISPKSVLSYTESDTLNVFRSGNAAFMRYWSSGYPPANRTDSPVRGRFSVTLLPAGPHGRAQTMGGFQLAVSLYSAHPREAAELVNYLTGAYVQKRRAVQSGYLPTRPRLYDDPELLQVLPQARALRNAGLESWVARPSAIAGNAYVNVSKAYYEAVHSVLSRQRQPEEALEDIDKRLTELLRHSRPPQN